MSEEILCLEKPTKVYRFSLCVFPLQVRHTLGIVFCHSISVFSALPWNLNIFSNQISGSPKFTANKVFCFWVWLAGSNVCSQTAFSIFFRRLFPKFLILPQTMVKRKTVDAEGIHFLSQTSSSLSQSIETFAFGWLISKESESLKTNISRKVAIQRVIISLAGWELNLKPCFTILRKEPDGEDNDSEDEDIKRPKVVCQVLSMTIFSFSFIVVFPSGLFYWQFQFA